jgi:sensor c-di-GMP phosphodiesterase-like protein
VEYLPHRSFDRSDSIFGQSRLDEVAIALTAHSVDCDALHMMKQHRIVGDLEEEADALLRDDVSAVREEGPFEDSDCSSRPLVIESHAREIFLAVDYSNEVKYLVGQVQGSSALASSDLRSRSPSRQHFITDQSRIDMPSRTMLRIQMSSRLMSMSYKRL